MAGISLWQLGIVLGIVVLLFGTGKLRNLGSDLGSAIKGFKAAAAEDGAAVPEAGRNPERLDAPPQPAHCRD